MKNIIVKIRKPKIKLILWSLLTLGGMLLLLFSQPAITSAASGKKSNLNYHKSHILVKFSPEVENEIKQGKKPNIPNKLERKISKGKVWQIEAGDGESVENLLKKYKKEYSSMIQYAQPDYECWTQCAIDNRYIQGSSSESPLKNAQFLWYLDDININEAWNETRGNPSVVIAVLDTGAAYENANIEAYKCSRVSSLSTEYKKAPGLGNLNLWVNSQEQPNNSLDDDGDGYVDDVNGFNFIDHDGYPHDDNGHGTFLTNLIAYNFETEGNTIGIASQCTFMILKVLDQRGRGYSSTVAEGIYYAVDHGARVINLSLAWPVGIEPGPVVSEAIAYAAGAGVIMVGGTGNSSQNKVCYPAAYDEVIAVGATQLDHTRAWYSNYGSELEIMAPGGNSYLDLDMDGYPDGILQETFYSQYQLSLYGEEILANTSIFGYWFLQGTSVATAIATGVVGLMISADPNLNLPGIRNILHNTATDLGPAGWDKEYGYGLINAGMAINQVRLGWQDQNPAPVPDPPPVPDPAPLPVISPTLSSDQSGQHPDCVNDLEIETECDDIETECYSIETECDEIETECDGSLNDEKIEGECPN